MTVESKPWPPPAAERAAQVDLRVVDPLPTSSPSVAAPDGARAELHDDALELRDGGGHLLFRYRDGQAQVFAPRGDLSFCAPDGRIRLRSGMDVEIDAARDVVQRPGRAAKIEIGEVAQPQLEVDGRRVELRTPRLGVVAERSHIVTGQATVWARNIATTAQSLAANVERYELTAQRLVEKSRDTFREVSGLLQSRVGRARTLVRGVYALYSRRTTMTSKQDTAIDGKRVLLG